MRARGGRGNEGRRPQVQAWLDTQVPPSGCSPRRLPLAASTLPSPLHHVNPKSWSSLSTMPQTGSPGRQVLGASCRGRLLCLHPPFPGPAHDQAIFPGRQPEVRPELCSGSHPASPVTPCCLGSLRTRPPSRLLGPLSPPLSSLGIRTKPRPGHVSHLLVCFKNMYLIYTRSLVRSAPLAQTTAGMSRLSLPPFSCLLLPSCWSSCSSRKKKKKKSHAKC